MIAVVKGSDPALVARALHELVEELLDGDDRTLAVEEITIPGRATGDDGDGADSGRAGAVHALLLAAESPPFMTASRIVVVRDYEQLAGEHADAVAALVDAPLPSTHLVFVSGGGRVAKRLADALKDARVVGPASEKTVDVLAESLAAAGISMANEAGEVVVAHLGQDAGRIPALVDVLVAAYGRGARLGAADVAPYLAEAGAVPVWELTNRIEEGDTAGALAVLDRLLHVTSPRQPKPMHPLQVMGLLHSRYRKLAMLDDPEITTAEAAHAALGGKGSSFPSRKALDAARALGPDGIRRAFDHLHEADIGLKGATGMPEETVMEVLVVRLSALAARHARGGGAARRR